MTRSNDRTDSALSVPSSQSTPALTSPLLSPGAPPPLALTYYANPGKRQPLQFWRNLWQRQQRTMVGVAIAITSVSWGWTLTRTPIYQSSFQLLVQPPTAAPINLNLNPGAAIAPTVQPSVVPSFDYATQIAILRSQQQLQVSIDRLRATYPTLSYPELANQLAIAQLQDNHQQPTKILAVTYADANPAKVKAVLDQLAKDYLAYSVSEQQANARRGVEFIKQQLSALNQRVATLQRKLLQFRQTNQLIDPEARGAAITNLLNSIDQQQKDAQTQLLQVRTLYTNLQRQVGITDPKQAIAAVTLSESPRYQNLLNQIQAVETEIATESARFQPDSPQIQILMDKRQGLIDLLPKEAQHLVGRPLSKDASGNMTSISLSLSKQLVEAANQIKQLTARNQALEDTERKLRQELATLPVLTRQYTDLKRELQLATDRVAQLRNTQQSLEMAAVQEVVPWQLILPPEQPTHPISPNLPRDLSLGAIAALLFGLGAGIAANRWDRAVHSPDELQQTIQLPLLGVIPLTQQWSALSLMSRSAQLSPAQSLPPASSAANGSNTEPNPVTGGTPATGDNPATSLPSSEIAALTAPLTAHLQTVQHYCSTAFLESFLSLHTSLQLLNPDTPVRSLVISSALPTEGKSTIACHLAKVAAAMGQRVLVVDADLRRPQIHQTLGLSNLLGLTNLITSTVPMAQVLQQPDPTSPLHVLTAGPIPPDPVQLLTANRMRELMVQFSTEFDLVIYDTPPLLNLPDSHVLLPQTDGLVLVVGVGHTDYPTLTQTVERLRINQTKILGMVANKVVNPVSAIVD